MRLKTVGLLLTPVLIAIGLAGQNSNSKPEMKAIQQTDKGIAIDGYDTVAYFTDAKPVKGRSKYSYAWNGANWWFSSLEHQKLFAAKPGLYAPQYGGYCAMSMTGGVQLSTDPEAWKIVGGKLYFVHNKALLPAWEARAEDNIDKANSFWPKLYK